MGKVKIVISFLVGMFIGRYGIPISIHLFYLTIIVCLISKIILKY
jgi:hypothetical protein